MQLLIDVNEETPAGLRLAASVLLIMAGAEAMTEEEIHAAARNPRQPANPKPLHPTPPPIGKPQEPAPVVPLPPGNVPPPPVEHPPVHPDALPKTDPPADVPAGTDLDPAQVFGGANSAPLVAATGPAVPAAPVAQAPVPAGNPAPSTQSPAVASASSSERDSAGLPWDARVHSETKKKNADGSWRFRRNLDEAVKTSVMAELRATYGQQSIPTAPAASPPAAAPVPPPPAAAAPIAAVPPPPATEDNGVRYDGNTPTVIPPPPAATPVPVPPAPSVGVSNADSSGVLPAGQPVTSFRDLMQKVNQALAAGRLTQPQLAEACKSAGVEGIAALAAQPMLVPQVDTYLNRWLAVAA